MTATRLRLPEAEPLRCKITPSPDTFKRDAQTTATAFVRTGGKGIRTPDLLIANETLYQLSYTPERGANLSMFGGFCIKRNAIASLKPI